MHGDAWWMHDGAHSLFDDFAFAGDVKSFELIACGVVLPWGFSFWYGCMDSGLVKIPTRDRPGPSSQDAVSLRMRMYEDVIWLQDVLLGIHVIEMVFGCPFWSRFQFAGDWIRRPKLWSERSSRLLKCSAGDTDNFCDFFKYVGPNLYLSGQDRDRFIENKGNIFCDFRHIFFESKGNIFVIFESWFCNVLVFCDFSEMQGKVWNFHPLPASTAGKAPDPFYVSEQDESHTVKCRSFTSSDEEIWGFSVNTPTKLPVPHVQCT